MRMYDRHKREYIETEQYGQGKLQFLYGNPIGRILLKLAISPFTSRLYGFYNSLPVSAKKIPPFIEKYQISLDEYEKSEFLSIDDEAEKIEEYVKTNLGGSVYALCGLSMGGKIANRIFERSNIGVKNLVLDGAPLVKG